MGAFDPYFDIGGGDYSPGDFSPTVAPAPVSGGGSGGSYLPAPPAPVKDWTVDQSQSPPVAAPAGNHWEFYAGQWRVVADSAAPKQPAAQTVVAPLPWSAGNDKDPLRAPSDEYLIPGNVWSWGRQGYWIQVPASQPKADNSLFKDVVAGASDASESDIRLASLEDENLRLRQALDAVGSSGYQTGQGKVQRLLVHSLTPQESLMMEMYEKQAKAGGSTHDSIILNISQSLGMPEQTVRGVLNRLLAAGSAAALLALTGSFPIAAMAHFGLNSVLNQYQTKEVFNGTRTGEAYIDGQPIVPLDVEIPNGLPNEVFADYRYVCYDRLSGKWWPTDEIQPLAWDGNEDYRWVCMDRVTGSVYHANLVKKPRIYLD